jgi:hypothetical protein
MKLTPINADEARARSAPVRLAAKRSPPAFGGAGLIDGRRRRIWGGSKRGFRISGPEWDRIWTSVRNLCALHLCVCAVLEGRAAAPRDISTCIVLV